MDKTFSRIVARQRRLVDRQEKEAAAAESRAKRVVARVKRLRNQADGVERSAQQLVHESKKKRLVR
jgi:hypothetical protein